MFTTHLLTILVCFSLLPIFSIFTFDDILFCLHFCRWVANKDFLDAAPLCRPVLGPVSSEAGITVAVRVTSLRARWEKI